MASQSCYYQRLMGGGYEAIVQAKDYQHNDNIKVIMRRRFRTEALAKEWYDNNKDDICKAVRVIFKKERV